jgi:hypothetical protein
MVATSPQALAGVALRLVDVTNKVRQQDQRAALRNAGRICARRVVTSQDINALTRDMRDVVGAGPYRPLRAMSFSFGMSAKW